MSDHDLLADLPAPRDDEPPSLRADIADELADHLRCALRREVFKDGHEAAAQQRVLDRFGDPKKLARRLWWQAMWSLIMRQRILSGVQWLVSLAAVALAGAVFWQQSQMWREMRAARQEEAVQRQALTTALNQIQAVYSLPMVAPQDVPVRIPEEELSPFDVPAEPPEPGNVVAGMPPVWPGTDEGPTLLKMKFVLERPDGPPISPYNVQLSKDDVLIGGPVAMTGPEVQQSAGNQFVYGPLEPGRYDLSVTLADHQSATRQVLIRDEKPQELTVVCPGPRPTATVLVTMPMLPEDLQKAATEFEYRIIVQPVVLDGLAWQPPSRGPHTLSFDPKTGEAIALVEPDKRTDLRKAKPEDRLVFMPQGVAATGFSLALRERKNMTEAYVDTVDYPSASPDGGEVFVPRTIEPGENRWSIDLPEEFLKQARESLRRLKGLNEDPIAHSPDDDRFSPFSPSSSPREVLPPKSAAPPQIALNLVQDKEDHPPADVNCVVIESRKTQQAAVEQGSADERRFVFQTLAADHYRLTVRLADGQECTLPLLIRDDKPRELTIVCPGMRKEVPVSITLPPLPEELRKRKFQVRVNIQAGPVQLEQTKWTASGFPSQTVTFDPATGLPAAIETRSDQPQRRFDLSELPPDERSVFLPVGVVYYSFSATAASEEPGSALVYGWPNGVRLKQTITADQQTWKLELPQEYLDMMGQGETGAGVQ